MPFKTKSRKLAAKDRRYVYVQKFQLGYEGSKHEKVETFSGQKQAAFSEDYLFVKSDLLKIFFLALLVVFIQTSLFLILRQLGTR